jgi:hypothetical protein
MSDYQHVPHVKMGYVCGKVERLLKKSNQEPERFDNSYEKLSNLNRPE